MVCNSRVKVGLGLSGKGRIGFSLGATCRLHIIQYGTEVWQSRPFLFPCYIIIVFHVTFTRISKFAFSYFLKYLIYTVYSIVNEEMTKLAIVTGLHHIIIHYSAMSL